MKIDISAEIQFRTARSGGKGGQNVNKVETMVEGLFTVADSQLLTDEQKALVLEKLQHRITKDGILLVKSQSERTQLANKQQVTQKMNLLVADALKPVKKRKPTRVPKAVKEKRIANKKHKSDVKEGRRKVREV